MRAVQILIVLSCAVAPVPASAQWAVSTYTGTNQTRPSTISIDRPDIGMSLEFKDVGFDAMPFATAPYYGARLTRFFAMGGRLGVELELLHSKVYARTRDEVDVQGTVGGFPVNGHFPMSAFVQRYNHTHGLNFLLANIVWRQPFGGNDGRVAVQFRGGAGPVRPGRDVVMPDLNVQGYEFAGIGTHAAAGITARLTRLVSAMVEYKLTHARPEIDLTRGGRGRMTTTSHHLVFGVTVGR